MMKKQCGKCKEEKDFEHFYKSPRGRLGLQTNCIPCHVKESGKYQSSHPEVAQKKYSKWSANNKDAMREYSLLRTYGINRAQYDWLLASQGGCCKICFKTPEENGKMLSVDHDHDTKDVRGLLCQPCNMALGLLKDSAWTFRAAAEYLDNSVSRWA
jgi:hypothetical protein